MIHFKMKQTNSNSCHNILLPLIPKKNLPLPQSATSQAIYYYYTYVVIVFSIPCIQGISPSGTGYLFLTARTTHDGYYSSIAPSCTPNLPHSPLLICRFPIAGWRIIRLIWKIIWSIDNGYWQYISIEDYSLKGLCSSNTSGSPTALVLNWCIHV